jgi:hypothetical protein
VGILDFALHKNLIGLDSMLAMRLGRRHSEPQALKEAQRAQVVALEHCGQVATGRL